MEGIGRLIDLVPVPQYVPIGRKWVATWQCTYVRQTFDTLNTYCSEDRRPKVVSIIGSTTHGKSFLLDLLRSSTAVGQRPFVVQQQSTLAQSTTCGVNAHVDGDVFYLDFEGLSGTLPRGVTIPDFPQLDGGWKAARKKVTSEVLPGIGFSSSNVVVYVTRATLVDSSAYTAVIDAAKTATSGVNDFAPPSLIVIQNRAAPAEFQTSAALTDIFKSHDEDDKLRHYFSSVRCFQLPDVHYVENVTPWVDRIRDEIDSELNRTRGVLVGTLNQVVWLKLFVNVCYGCSRYQNVSIQDMILEVSQPSSDLFGDLPIIYHAVKRYFIIQSMKPRRLNKKDCTKTEQNDDSEMQSPVMSNSALRLSLPSSPHSANRGSPPGSASGKTQPKTLNEDETVEEEQPYEWTTPPATPTRRDEEPVGSPTQDWAIVDSTGQSGINGIKITFDDQNGKDENPTSADLQHSSPDLTLEEHPKKPPVAAPSSPTQPVGCFAAFGSEADKTSFATQSDLYCTNKELFEAEALHVTAMYVARLVANDATSCQQCNLRVAKLFPTAVQELKKLRELTTCFGFFLLDYTSVEGSNKNCSGSGTPLSSDSKSGSLCSNEYNWLMPTHPSLPANAARCVLPLHMHAGRPHRTLLPQSLLGGSTLRHGSSSYYDFPGEAEEDDRVSKAVENIETYLQSSILALTQDTAKIRSANTWHELFPTLSANMLSSVGRGIRCMVCLKKRDQIVEPLLSRFLMWLTGGEVDKAYACTDCLTQLRSLSRPPNRTSPKNKSVQHPSPTSLTDPATGVLQFPLSTLLPNTSQPSTTGPNDTTQNPKLPLHASSSSSASISQPLQHHEPDSGSEDGDEDSQCVICCSSPRCVCLKPCGHVAMCVGCLAKGLSWQGRPQCPLCRKHVTSCYDISHANKWAYLLMEGNWSSL
eukprot:TRINITY_DN115039_c0_g1_i1.p1 TRINITY_DN115039_c0_g1~~TRINITY_DN115039_c0_g1_i1.p1  ORF type:complete len:921 (-),score=44.21 TRINITY_DN115039_c0_g1_i1:94-2856(-)